MKSVESEPAYTQVRPGYCGIAGIQAVLESQFGHRTTQQELAASANHLLRKTAEYRAWAQRVPRVVAQGDVVEALGVGPQVLAQTSRKQSAQDLRVFISRTGDLDQLAELREHGHMPIIHSVVASKADPVPGSHYLTVRHIGKKRVTWFDPSSVGGGFKFASHEKFLGYWLTYGEFWYMAVLPSDETLPKDVYKGRYL